MTIDLADVEEIAVVQIVVVPDDRGRRKGRKSCGWDLGVRSAISNGGDSRDLARRGEREFGWSLQEFGHFLGLFRQLLQFLHNFCRLLRGHFLGLELSSRSRTAKGLSRCGGGRDAGKNSLWRGRVSRSGGIPVNGKSRWDDW